jgi:glucokinase
MILVGDIGATKTRIAFYFRESEVLNERLVKTYVSNEFSCLEEMVDIFLKEYPEPVTSACFGAPGPVINHCVKTTNLPWEICEDQINHRFSISKVKLVNDLEATAASVPYLSSKELIVLSKGEGEKNKAIYAVVAPGTGLGVGFIFRDTVQHSVFASEAGHVDFAPTNELEIQLLKYLQRKFDRVSYERLLCGSGLVNIYMFIKESGYASEPAELAVKLTTDDPAAVISKTGQSKTNDICVKALDIFTSILGSFVGNLALTLFATGGIYLGGGIPPKILNKLTDGSILTSYFNKGRLSPLVKQTPLMVIRDDRAALLGAASIAAQL